MNFTRRACLWRFWATGPETDKAGFVACFALARLYDRRAIER